MTQHTAEMLVHQAALIEPTTMEYSSLFGVSLEGPEKSLTLAEHSV